MVEVAGDCVRMRPLLAAVCRGRFGSATQRADIEVETLGRRIVRYTVRMEAEGESEPKIWKMIGKVYEDPEIGRRGFEAMRLLWGDGFSRQAPDRVRIPEPYAWLQEACLLLMEEVPGRALKTLVKKGLARDLHMRAFAEAMAKLHRSKVVFGKPFTVEDQLQKRCLGLPEALAHAFPDLAEDIGRVVEAARRHERQRGHAGFTLAHGDWHLGQVHVDETRLWILDLEPLHYGDPAYDLAMAFVTLKRLEGRPRRRAYVRSLRDAFLSAAFEDGDWGAAGRVPLYEALIHLKRACKRFRFQDEEGWRETVQFQVRQSAACLAVMEQAREVRCLEDVVAIYEGC